MAGHVASPFDRLTKQRLASVQIVSHHLAGLLTALPLQVKAAFLAGLAVVLLLAAATRWLGLKIETCATAQMACKVRVKPCLLCSRCGSAACCSRMLHNALLPSF